MTRFSRRQMLIAGAAGTTAGLAGVYSNLTGDASAQSSPALSKWVQPLPIPSVRSPDGTRDGVDFYDVKMQEFTQNLHPDLPATTLWGFDGSYPGPTFDVQSGTPIQARFDNRDLPSSHLLTVDTSIDGTQSSDYPNYSGSVPEVRNSVHFHGANIAPEDDGQSMHWKSPDGVTGPAYTKDVQYMPNSQARGTLMYHPHALGITRLNVYAGLGGLYMIRDDDEANLNLPTGSYEVPLVIQDRTFNSDGSLYYPDGITAEFGGDTALVNGAVWPYLSVEPRRYRFRLANMSNARAYNLSLRNDTSSGVPSMYQIATGHEFLENVVDIGPSGTQGSLTTTAFERAEIIVDFSGYEGDTLTLTNNAEFPYQGDNSGAGLSEIMQFQVQSTSVSDPTTHPSNLSLPAPTSYSESNARTTRTNTLDMQLVDGQATHMLNGQTMLSGGSIHRPHLDTTEVWEFDNTTSNTHPIHMHLVTFRVIGRGSDGTVAPDPNEQGPKDVVRVDPSETVRVIPEFHDHTGKYPWHCHMLEHEDNSMMRMFDVVRGELLNYANSSSVIDQAGVEAAMADYENGVISREVLTDAINRWRSGEPVE